MSAKTWDRSAAAKRGWQKRRENQARRMAHEAACLRADAEVARLRALGMTAFRLGSMAAIQDDRTPQGMMLSLDLSAWERS